MNTKTDLQPSHESVIHRFVHWRGRNPFLVWVAVAAVMPLQAEQPLTESAAVEAAVTNNRDLVAARVRVKEAQARLQQAGLLPNPEVEIGGRIAPSEGEHSFSFLLNQPFSVSGRIGAQKDVARGDIRRTIAEVADLERRAARETRRTFVEWQTLEEQIQLQQFLIGLNENLLSAIKAALARGEVSEKDVNAIEIARQQAQQRRKLLETQRRSRVLELNRLMGHATEADAVIATALEFQAAPDLSAFAAEKALERRPDFVAAQMEVEIAKAEQRLAKAERYADWRVGAGYENERGHDFGNPAGSIDRDNFVALQLSIPLPLFDRKQGRIRETLAREERARKTADALKAEIERELADARQRVQTLAPLLESYTPEILKRAEDNVKLVENGYRAGQTSIVEVIQSRQQFAELKSSYFDTLREYRAALIDLEIASGIFPTSIKLNKPNEGKKP